MEWEIEGFTCVKNIKFWRNGGDYHELNPKLPDCYVKRYCLNLAHQISKGINMLFRVVKVTTRIAENRNGQK